MPKAVYEVVVMGLDGRFRVTTETSLRAVKSLCHGLNLDITVCQGDARILWKVRNGCDQLSSVCDDWRKRFTKSGYLFAPPVDAK